MNREQRRRYVKSVKIMGKRLSRSQRKYVYKELLKKEKDKEREP